MSSFHVLVQRVSTLSFIWFQSKLYIDRLFALVHALAQELWDVFVGMAASVGVS